MIGRVEANANARAESSRHIDRDCMHSTQLRLVNFEACAQSKELGYGLM
jgi:hypothetical protein